MERVKAWLRRRWLLVAIAIAFLIHILTQINDLAAVGRALLQGRYLCRRGRAPAGRVLCAPRY